MNFTARIAQGQRAVRKQQRAAESMATADPYGMATFVAG